MEFIEVKKLGHAFKVKDGNGNVTGEKWAVKDVDLIAHKGEILAILGKNGSGKSTFAKHLNGLYAPDAGTVRIYSKLADAGYYDTSVEEDLVPIRQMVGMIFQNPDNQMVGNTVAEDIGFGLENLEWEPDAIWARIREITEKTGMDAYIDRSVQHLSGGQKQRLAIASVLAMRPSCIIMDEATAMLDPRASLDILEFIQQLNREYKITIIMITHRMEETRFADHIYVMDEGHIAMSGRPQDIYPQVQSLMDFGLESLTSYHLAERLGMTYKRDAVLDLQDVAAWTEQKISTGKMTWQDVQKAVTQRHECEISDDVLIRAEDISYSYANEKQRISAVRNVSFEVKRGDFLALAGTTGSGKSTLLYMLNGLYRPESGQLLVDGIDVRTTKNLKKLRKNIGFVFQYPDDQLFAGTVLEDVMFAPLNFGMSKKEAECAAKEALQLVNIPEEQYRYAPFSLSGGQKKRVALAGILAYHPKLLILDEPVAGMDPQSKREFFDLLRRLNKERGVTVIFVSHDMKDVYATARRLIVMKHGEITFDGKVTDAFQREEIAAGWGLVMPELAKFQSMLR